MAIRVIAYATPAVCIGSFAGVHFVLDGARLRIGRARDCDVRLPDLSVSPHHASLEHDGRGYALVDEGSAHGTYLGALDSTESRWLVAGERCRVAGPTFVSVGPFRLLLCPRAWGPADGPAERTTATLRLLALMAGMSGKGVYPSVFVRRGPSRGRRFYVQDGLLFEHSYNASCVLGRDPFVDGPLRGSNVSRHHCVVKRWDHALWVRDLDSTNGTWLAGERLPAGTNVRWRRGHSLYVGDNALDQEDAVADALDELDLKEGDTFTDARLPTFPIADETRVRGCALDDLAATAVITDESVLEPLVVLAKSSSDPSCLEAGAEEPAPSPRAEQV